MALFDVNEFGQLNKEYGHVYGDRFLKKIARVIKDNAEDNCDLVCRYGDDESVLVSLSNICNFEKKVKAIFDLINSEVSKAGVAVTVSAGICGGQRKYARNELKYYKVFEHLINKASLASTKEKATAKNYVLDSS